MTDQQKDLASSAPHTADQAADPIDPLTLGRLSRSRLTDLIQHGPRWAIEQVPALAPFRDLLQAALDASDHALNLDAVERRDNGPLSAEQEAEVVIRWDLYGDACGALETALQRAELLAAQ